MKKRCPGAISLGVATLKNHRIGFAGHSLARNGAVATVIPKRDVFTNGILYRMSFLDLKLLDRYEGYPLFYNRTPRTVKDKHGQLQSAWVYQLPTEYPEGPPSDDYFFAIRKAYQKMEWSIDDLVEAQRRGHEGSIEFEKFLIFVYGTLRQGELNHRLLEGSKCLGTVKTEPRFNLIDLQHFPGLIPGGNTSVTGELFTIDDFTLHKLDRLEGHPTFYRRENILLQDGREVLTYIYHQSSERSIRKIASGDWIKYRKHKV